MIVNYCLLCEKEKTINNNLFCDECREKDIFVRIKAFYKALPKKDTRYLKKSKRKRNFYHKIIYEKFGLEEENHVIRRKSKKNASERFKTSKNTNLGEIPW